MRFHPQKCKYIVSVGIEVECGVRTEEDYRRLWDWVGERNEVAERFEDGSDGSVHVEGCAYQSLELRFWVPVSRWELMEAVLFFLWNDIRIQQNSTCGNHVHVKLNDDYLPLLVFPQFVLYFQRSYNFWSLRQRNPMKYRRRRWGSYSAFYRGRDVEVEVIRQYRGGGSRYRCINYHSLYEWQRTVEFRIMPHAENLQEHLSQIIFVLRTVENYISTVLRGRRVLECSEVSLTTFSPPQLQRLWCSFEVPQALAVSTIEVANELPPVVVEVNNPTM